MYDLRFCPLPPPMSSPNLQSSKPYLCYPNYRNVANIRLGFDLSISLGIIAAAQDGQRVSMFDLWSTQEIVPRWGKEKQWPANVSTLSFIGDEEGCGGGAPRTNGLLVGSGPIIEEWR